MSASRLKRLCWKTEKHYNFSEEDAVAGLVENESQFIALEYQRRIYINDLLSRCR